MKFLLKRVVPGILYCLFLFLIMLSKAYPDNSSLNMLSLLFLWAGSFCISYELLRLRLSKKISLVFSCSFFILNMFFLEAYSIMILFFLILFLLTMQKDRIISDVFIFFCLYHFAYQVFFTLRFSEFFLVSLLTVLVIDTSAYLFGFFIKETLIAKGIFSEGFVINKSISPNKTYFGLIAGFIFGVLFFIIMSWYLNVDPYPFSSMIVPGIIVFSLATLGDFVQSALKRRYSIKHMGSLFGNHGGLLDRMDSLLAVCLFMVLLDIIFSFS